LRHTLAAAAIDQVGVFFGFPATIQPPAGSGGDTPPAASPGADTTQSPAPAADAATAPAPGQAPAADTTSPRQGTVTRLRAATTTVRLVKGATVKLPVAVYGTGGPATLTWKASKAAVATPAKGKARGTLAVTALSTANAAKAGLGRRVLVALRALKTGTSVVTVTAASGVKATIKVVVVPRRTAATRVAVTGKASLAVGAVTTLKGRVTPAKATGAIGTWTSSKPKVAQVDAAGRVLARSKGKAVITFTAAGKKTRHTVTVR
jgi:hypothetical protein